MVKGINRQVIEITDTGSVYYEKAWLMVKPVYAQLQQSLLDNEAKVLLKELDAPSSMKKKRTLRARLLWMIPSAAAGAVLSTLIQLIF